MNDMLARLLIVASVLFGAWALIRLGGAWVERSRALALQAPAMGEGAHSNKVTILAFGSEDCRACHVLQNPALDRVLAARGDAVRVTHVDAPTVPDLTARYRVLTLPATVVLDAGGVARAVNYGYAPTERLLEQIGRAEGAA